MHYASRLKARSNVIALASLNKRHLHALMLLLLQVQREKEKSALEEFVIMGPPLLSSGFCTTLRAFLRHRTDLIHHLQASLLVAAVVERRKSEQAEGQRFLSAVSAVRRRKNGGRGGRKMSSSSSSSWEREWESGNRKSVCGAIIFERHDRCETRKEEAERGREEDKSKTGSAASKSELFVVSHRRKMDVHRSFLPSDRRRRGRRTFAGK